MRRCVTRSLTTGKKRDYLREILNAVRVYDVATETPLTYAPTMSKRLDCEVYLKREDMQPVFSFKIRGAYNKIAQLTAEEKAKGVVACSAGNHAQGVALSCRKLGIDAVIVMPRGTPKIKVDAVRSHGGDATDVRLVGDTYDEAAAEAGRLMEAGRTLIHPFNDPAIIAGQGTVGYEILKQMSGRRLDAIFCCVGGGGLLAGVAAYVKQVRPEVKVYGVEAVDAAGMTTSLAKGEVVSLDHVGLFADGAAVKTIGNETYDVAATYVDGMITVTNDEICAAIKAGFTDGRCVLEPAGALALAGLTKHVSSSTETSHDANFVAVASGANMDFDRLRFVSERADTSEVRLALRIPEEPGAFRALYQLIHPCNVTEFSYRYHRPDRPADIILSFQPQTNQWFNRLSNAGYDPRDVTHDEFVSAHLRHLAGGRLLDKDVTERLFRFEFPEAPGALNNFLTRLQPSNGSGALLNCSLFHYRNYGHDVGRVLVGLIVDQDDALDTFLTTLGYRYVEETQNPSYHQFLSSRE